MVACWSGPEEHVLEAFWISTGLVALGEMGDKTQLLAVLLAARFKKPVPIMLGILLATLANHALAGALGGWIAAALGPDVLRWVIGLSFIAMAAWMLVPDKIEEDLAVKDIAAWGVLGTTLVAFFLAEMGDKTQIATVALAARYPNPVLVVVGTTLGMLIADVPAVFVGDRLAAKIPMKLVHGVAAAIFSRSCCTCFCTLGLCTKSSTSSIASGNTAAGRKYEANAKSMRASLARATAAVRLATPRPR